MKITDLSALLKSAPLFSLGREFLSIEFGGADMRLVHLRSQGKALECANCAIFNITGQTEADVGNLLLNALTQYNIKDPTVSLVIPSHLVVQRRFCTDHNTT